MPSVNDYFEFAVFNARHFEFFCGFTRYIPILVGFNVRFPVRIDELCFVCFEGVAVFEPSFFYVDG